MSAKIHESKDLANFLSVQKGMGVHKSLKLAAKLLVFLLLTAGLRGQTALDSFDPNANGAIRVVVVQTDGKILIGGDFTALSPNMSQQVRRHRVKNPTHRPS